MDLEARIRLLEQSRSESVLRWEHQKERNEEFCERIDGVHDSLSRRMEEQDRKVDALRISAAKLLGALTLASSIGGLLVKFLGH